MIKVRLYKIRINQGGYDDTGRYWGTGLPLYHYEFETDRRTINEEFRAADRESALDLVRLRLAMYFPELKFSIYGVKPHVN